MIAHDTAGTESAISDIAQNVADILPYVQAMMAISLGPQPIVLDGQAVASWDPLGTMPAVETALQTAQQHCNGFTIYAVDVLRAYPLYLSSVVGSAGSAGIVNDLAEVAAVMTQLSNGAAPTSAQRQTVDGALADIVRQIGGLQSALSGVQSQTATFQDELPADLEALNTGAQTSVATAISNLRTAYTNAVIQYSLGPGGSAIVKILSQITQQMNTSLTGIQDNINAAVSAEGSVSPALGRLQNLFTGLLGDYTNVAQQAQQASDATFGNVLQQIDCSVLQQYWQDTSSFATAHGFGVPSTS